jgi:predicted SnoaL-like aldol condensation-catalyzing enzyme
MSNADLIRRYYDEVFNRRNVDFLRAQLHPAVVGHGPGLGDEVRGIDAVVAFTTYVWQAYDDYTLVVDGTVADGDRVVVRATVTARHRATGRPVRFFGLSEYRLEAGLIREYWRAYDRLDLYDAQLGGWRPGQER